MIFLTTSFILYSAVKDRCLPHRGPYKNVQHTNISANTVIQLIELDKLEADARSGELRPINARDYLKRNLTEHATRHKN